MGVTRHSDDVTGAEAVVVVGGEDEDAFRGRGVGVCVGVRGLEIETLDPDRCRALEVADDNALGGDRAGDRGAQAAALDGVDGGVAEGTEVRVVVADRADALRVEAVRAADVGDVDEEGLVGLLGRVAVHVDAEAVGRAAGRDGLGSEGLRHVVGVGDGRRVVRGGDVEGDATGGRDTREAHCEIEGGGPGVAFVRRHVVDREIDAGRAEVEGIRGVARSGQGGREVRGVVVGVLAAGSGPEACRRVAQGRRRGRALEEVRRPVADEVDNLGQLGRAAGR